MPTPTTPTEAPEHRPTDIEHPVSRIPAWARHRPFAWILLTTGVVGWVASAILASERLALYRNPEHVTSCDVNPWVSCGQVMGTWQSELFGFPNPLIGIVAFAVVITTAMLLLSGARAGRWYWLGLQAGVTAGTVFVIWLWSQALFSIYILCLYCMIVWAAMIPMFVLLTIRNLIHGILPAPSRLVRFVATWAGTLVAITYVAVAASVVVVFFPVLTSS